MPQPDYFAADYPRHRSDLEVVDSLLIEVFETINKSFDGDAWPYAIRGEESDQVPARISVSTQAMVLFGIAAGLGYVSVNDFGPCTPGNEGRSTPLDALEKPLSEGLKATYRKALRSLLPQLSSNINKSAFGRSNPFTLSWLISAIAGLRAHHSGIVDEDIPDGLDAEFAEWVETAVSRLVTLTCGEPRLLEIEDEKLKAAVHSFPALRALHLREIAKRVAGSKVACLQAAADASSNCVDASQLEQIAQWFGSRVHEQLAFATIRDAPFDAAELAFSLEGHLLATGGDGRSAAMHDPDLVDRVFAVLQSRQEANPYWRPLRPLVTDDRGFALLPLSVEIVNSLLRTCSLLGESGLELFSSHREIFDRYHDWLIKRQVRVCHRGTLCVGWQSEHVQEAGCIHVWETSQVATYLLQYREMLRVDIGTRTLAAAKLSSPTKPRNRSGETGMAYWKKVAQPKDPRHKESGVLSHIGRAFVAPRTTEPTLRKDSSMLLYGPPGTGKTSVAEDIATALKWPLLTITPSDFVAGGESAIELRAKEIFTALNEQRRVVILLDEIDRLILDRDAPAYASQSDMFQVLTPGMLPKLKDLRSKASCIFIIATNYKERIDPAAVRPGRIDEHYLIGLPSFLSRKGILARAFDDCIERDSSLSGALDLGSTDGDEISGVTAMANYGELKKLAQSAASACADGGGLPTKVLLDKARKFVPAMRLSSYRSRFRVFCKDGRDIASKDEPWLEFYDMAFLLCENEHTAKLLWRDPHARETLLKVIESHCLELGIPSSSEKGRISASKLALHLEEDSEKIGFVPKEYLSAIIATLKSDQFNDSGNGSAEIATTG